MAIIFYFSSSSFSLLIPWVFYVHMRGVGANLANRGRNQGLLYARLNDLANTSGRNQLHSAGRLGFVKCLPLCLCVPHARCVLHQLFPRTENSSVMPWVEYQIEFKIFDALYFLFDRRQIYLTNIISCTRLTPHQNLEVLNQFWKIKSVTCWLYVLIGQFATNKLKQKDFSSQIGLKKTGCYEWLLNYVIESNYPALLAN